MTLFQAFGQFANSGGVEVIGGYDIITPSSVSTSSGTATIGANGTVTMTTCVDVTLNDVFTSAYDVYMILITGTGSDGNLVYRFTSSGTPETGGIYDRIYTVGDGASTSTTAGQNATSQFLGWFGSGSRSTTMYRLDLYRPTDTGVSKNVLGQGSTPTTSANISNWNTATIVDSASAYDGFIVYEATSTMTGEVSVYGVRKA